MAQRVRPGQWRGVWRRAFAGVLCLVVMGLAASAPHTALAGAARPAAAPAASVPLPQSGLVPFRTPSGGTIQIDARLVPAMTVLLGVEQARPLIDALARGGIRVEVADLDEWGHYQSSAQAIRIDVTLVGADPRAVAALLAHEASHARGDVDGIVEREEQTLGEVQECVADEHRATVTELQVYQQLFGPLGKQPPANAYEEQVNDQLAQYRASPDAFRASAPREHGAQCYS